MTTKEQPSDKYCTQYQYKTRTRPVILSWTINKKMYQYHEPALYYYLGTVLVPSIKVKSCSDTLYEIYLLEENISDKLSIDMDKLERIRWRWSFSDHTKERFSILRERRAWNQEICKTWMRWIISLDLNNHSECKQISLISIIAWFHFIAELQNLID